MIYRTTGYAGTLMLILICSSLAAEKDADSKLTASEQQILELTNQARAKEKLPPLKVNATLTRVARAHSANMAKKEEMKHELDGKGPKDRVEDAGYNFSWVGENIAWSSDLDTKEIFEGWMNSEGHRANILKKEYEEIGIGIVTTSQKEVYYTQVFGTPRKRR